MANRLLLLFSELRLLFTITTQANGYSTLHLEREEVLDTREEIFLLLLSVDHLNLLISSHTTFSFVLEEVAHADIIDLPIELMDIGDRLGNLGISSRVTFDE